MPELVPAHEAMVSEVAADEPLAARMFTMWMPPGAAIACSQPVLREGGQGSEARAELRPSGRADGCGRPADRADRPRRRRHDRGRGTVYTAVYDPADGDIAYVWPTSRLDVRIDAFTGGEHPVVYPPSPPS